MNRAERRKAGLKGKFSTRCFRCYFAFDFTPSANMMAGHNHGYGRCPCCGEDLELKVNAGTKTGTSSRWPYDKPPQ
jgi:hypothetical protein